jgi:hypothetical protein
MARERLELKCFSEVQNNSRFYSPTMALNQEIIAHNITPSGNRCFYLVYNTHYFFGQNAKRRSSKPSILG